MTFNQQLLEKKQKLESYIGQFIDLKRGTLQEIVIKKENIEALALLQECLQDSVEAIDTELRNEAIIQENTPTLKTYGVYIKSHSEAPDFETEVEAESKIDALNIIKKNYRGLEDFSDNELLKMISEI